jgi:hypothetical protein
VSPQLIAVYAGLALLGGLIVCDGGRDWRLRLAAIVTVPLLSFALWQAAQPPKGWPARVPVPESATFLWGVIREPQAGDAGRVFVWLDVGGDRPRAFSLPYSRQLHKKVQTAMDATKHGHTIAVTRPRRGRGQQRGGAMRFYPHPPIALPRKHGR